MRNIYLKRIADRVPLTDDEKAIIINAGWCFAGPDYIYIPDDYDGCMASGLRNIRAVLEGIKRTKV